MKYVAERKLFCSEKESHTKRAIAIKICQPYPVKRVGSGDEMSRCDVIIEGIEAKGLDVYGMDSLQAINIASNIEPLLERLSNEYDFFWDTGEPYFEE